MSHHHHHEGHHHEACCSHEHHHECCHEKESCCEGTCGHEDFTAHLLCMADQAWMEVLKEKIKEQINAHGGKHLDELAKAVAETNQARWEHKLAINNTRNRFKERLNAIFNKGKK